MIARSPKAVTKHEDETDQRLLVDTSRMNRGQASAMEVAERARDLSDASQGFAGRLFGGRYDRSLIEPFPVQSPQDKAIGDEMVERVSVYLLANLDPDEVDETRTIPEDVVDGLKRLGVFRMKIPTEYGGLGFSQVNYNRVLMAIASHCGSTAVLVSAHQSIGLPQPLKMCGTEEQRRRYLPRMAAGELSAFALTEREVGSDPARMTTTATLSDDGSHYVLTGVKQWTTNGPIADLLVVIARTTARDNASRGSGITAFIVEADSPGITTTHRCDFMGLRGIQNGILEFRDVLVPAENVIWGEGLGLKMALKTLNIGRLTLPAACTGMAKRCLSFARQWGRDRVQWGYPIGEHEAGAQKIALIACKTFAMEAFTWLTSHWADEGRDIRIEAAMAKLFCSEVAWEIVDTTMQLRGGRGYERSASLRARGEEDYPIERMMRDCRINTIIEGTSDIMKLFLAREALDPHLRRAKDLLRPGTPLRAKAKAGVRLAGHYGWWFPAQLAGAWVGPRHASMGRLARHGRYIDRTSHTLAASMFNAMVRHGPKLERRQTVLGNLMLIGTELTAMAATCAYAGQIARDDPVQGQRAEELASVFCDGARTRIGIMLRAVRRSDTRAINSLARRVMAGEHEWLERGVIEPTTRIPAQ
ncbi:MAG: acyl-CoA dehydrogenase family protein [Planctomycetes bacterium]|nr:acyl-CoA dehydrogenase family protein [Planctomycetota bacterium]